MVNMFKDYLMICWAVIMKPIFFYQDMPKGKWSEAPLTFALITSWIFSFAITVSVFFVLYIPTGLNLIDGIKGRELLIVTPVILLMGAVFFAFTLLIVGVFVIAAFLALFFSVAGILNFLLILLGGTSNFYETLKSVFYSSAVFLVGLFTILFAVLVKFNLMTFSDWLVGESTLFYAASIFLYGLWSIAGRKVHNVPRWKAFLAAIFPLLLIIIVNIVLAAKILPKMEAWIS